MASAGDSDGERDDRVPRRGYTDAPRTKDWAIVGVAAVVGADPRVALVNVGPTAVRARATVEALVAGESAADAAAQAADGLEPPNDLHASAEYRRHLATVLVRRALDEASARG